MKILITDIFWIKEYFTYLKTCGLYKSNVLEDWIVFLFIFVSILCSEINTFVATWNVYRICSQKKILNYIADISNELYTDQSLFHYRCTFNIELLLQLEKTVKNVNK